MPDIVLATINAKWIHPSLALRLLKANLGELEEQCEILEFALREPVKGKIEAILAARPRLLGLSISIWNHITTLELLKILEKEWDEKPIIVLGGPEISWLPEKAELFNYADFVIRGDGEKAFRLLCNCVFLGEDISCLPLSEIKVQNKTVAFINEADAAFEPDEIASAYRLYTDEDLQRKLVYVEASRGCPFGCEFCQGALTHKVRDFPLEPFLKDMSTLIERGCRSFKFLDRTFNLNIDRAIRIMEFFLSHIKERNFCVHFEMVPFRFPQPLREVLRRFPPGTLRLELGIQTLNPKTAALTGISGVLEEKLETLDFLIKETNAIVHVDLIAGLPGEDLRSFGEGFDRLWKVLPGNTGTYEIQLGILKCLPATPIARHNESRQMRYSPEPPYEVIETGALPAGELSKLKNFARFWELIVNRNAFPDLTPSLLPPEKPVFDRFMSLSEKLLERFGRNWGIDKKELAQALLLIM